MKEKLLIILASAIVLLVISLTSGLFVKNFYLQMRDQTNFAEDLISICLIGFIYFISCALLVLELRKITRRFWLTCWLGFVIFGSMLNTTFGGKLSIIENGVIGLIEQPLIWLLMATLIGHLTVFIYKRNKQSLN